MIDMIIPQENATKLLWDFILLLSERLKSIKEMSIHACEKIAKAEHVIIILRMQTCTFLWKSLGDFLQKLDIDILSTSTYTSLWHIPKDSISYYINTCSHMCIIGLVRFRKQPRDSLTLEYIMKVLCIYIILLLSKSKIWNLDINVQS